MTKPVLQFIIRDRCRHTLMRIKIDCFLGSIDVTL